MLHGRSSLRARRKLFVAENSINRLIQKRGEGIGVKNQRGPFGGPCIQRNRCAKQKVFTIEAKFSIGSTVMFHVWMIMISDHFLNAIIA